MGTCFTVFQIGSDDELGLGPGTFGIGHHAEIVMHQNGTAIHGTAGTDDGSLERKGGRSLSGTALVAKGPDTVPG